MHTHALHIYYRGNCILFERLIHFPFCHIIGNGQTGHTRKKIETIIQVSTDKLLYGYSKKFHGTIAECNRKSFL